MITFAPFVHLKIKSDFEFQYYLIDTCRTIVILNIIKFQLKKYNYFKKFIFITDKLLRNFCH